MRKTVGILFWILCLPCLVQAQYLAYQFSVFGGAGRPVQPGYFKDCYRSPTVFGFRLCVMFTDRSGTEFDFSSFSFPLDGARLVQSLAESGVRDAAVADGRIGMETATLSYLYFVTPPDIGPGLYVLAGIGMDRIDAEAVRITTPGAEPDTLYRDSMHGGFPPSLCAGLGLAVSITEKISLFGEARIHIIITKGVPDIVSGRRMKDFVEFWTPAAGLRYNF